MGGYGEGGYDDGGGGYDPNTGLPIQDGNKESLIRSKMLKLGGGQWQCAICSHVTKSTNLFYHIESKHVQGAGYTRPLCNKPCKSRNSYNVHMSMYHKGENK